ATVIRTYLDTVLELPYGKYTKERINLDVVRKNLDKQHYGLFKVKDRVIEQLAVRLLASKNNGQIICLVGPPGVGKTSIAKSIAESINRKYARIALGGISDEAEIRGHRKTYVGAMPGRIINAMKNAGSMNPLIVLDEIDKLASSFHGDPTSALLEVLDSEQNHAFCDHYIEVPFDLSDVFFITTANDLSSIPNPLKDRMDIIELSSYTREEKFQIAKKHLWRKQLKKAGLTSKNVKISNDALYSVIDNYTKEAGVRSLERKISDILRKCAVTVVNSPESIIKINGKNIEKYLGPKKYLEEIAIKSDEVGVTNGLAWTSVGGTILPIEVAIMDGTGKIEITGNLGDVMQESAKTAVSVLRQNCEFLNIDKDFYKTKDLHIHAPEGAIPKDGPSAGITIATAICSALTNCPIRHDIAMTGEITLRGKVLPIGGLREKAMAAYKAQISNVIIPKENLADIAEVDDIVKANISFIPVSHIKEVWSKALISPLDKKSDSAYNIDTSKQNKSSIFTQ
ncbi:MAG: endopeptidase La, partial [Acutalibacteraceae bacterium]